MKQHGRSSKKKRKLQNRNEVLLNQHMLIPKMKDLEVSDLLGETVHTMQHMHGGKHDTLLSGEEMQERGLQMQQRHDILQARLLQ